MKNLLSFVKNLIILVPVIIILLNLKSLSETITYNLDDVSVSIAKIDSKIKNNVTELEFEYLINNNSKNDIYIFTATLDDKEIDTIYSNSHVFNLGGAWKYLHGYEQVFHFTRIQKGGSYKKYIRMIISNTISSIYNIFDKVDRNYTNFNSCLITFNIGYYKNIDKLIENNVIESQDEIYEVDLNKNNFGQIFEINYYRPLIIFPVFIRKSVD